MFRLRANYLGSFSLKHLQSKRVGSETIIITRFDSDLFVGLLQPVYAGDKLLRFIVSQLADRQRTSSIG